MPNYFNPKVRVFVTKADKVEKLPLNEGNLIVAEEGGDLYFDLEERRVRITPTWKELT